MIMEAVENIIRQQLIESETQLKLYIVELTAPLSKRINELKSFNTAVKQQFGKQDASINKLADKFNSENIKIWKPYLEILIERRLLDYDNRRKQELDGVLFERVAQVEN